MKNHDYNFSGGNHLRRIGATYYVCYLHSLNKDSNEKRWQKIKTKDQRNKVIIKHSSFCKLWLTEISKMKKVSTNSMGLTVSEVNNYADELLKIPSVKFK
ncbi:MAG: hypothetical protein E7602_04890 [Ruminococcaceae bacterium]|nr:hypothetical protein [Oscillospiraceae bacterium]